MKKVEKKIVCLVEIMKIIEIVLMEEDNMRVVGNNYLLGNGVVIIEDCLEMKL